MKIYSTGILLTLLGSSIAVYAASSTANLSPEEFRYTAKQVHEVVSSNPEVQKLKTTVKDEFKKQDIGHTWYGQKGRVSGTKTDEKSIELKRL